MKRYIKPFIHATFFENQKLMAGSMAKHNEVGSKAQLGKETINMTSIFMTQPMIVAGKIKIRFSQTPLLIFVLC